MVEVPVTHVGSYELSSPTVHNQSNVKVLPFGGLDVSVPTQAWAYAATFSLHNSSAATPKPNELLCVRIAVGDVRGMIGVAILSGDGSKMLAQRDLTAADANSTVELSAGPIGICGDLLIRNASPTGAEGSIELRSIERVDWSSPYQLVRQRWSRVPAGTLRQSESGDLLALSDVQLIQAWETAHTESLEHQGWFEDFYRAKLRGLRVLDVGCGMAISTLHFAEHGAKLTFSDVVLDNINVVKRLCEIKGIEADFLYIEDASSFRSLRGDFDVVTSLGSLMTMPKEATREEIQAILPLLKTGGRWLHFAYPKSRWIRDGKPPFSEWAKRTDGPGTPWMEYHERDTIEFLFAPSKIDFVFDCEWHNHHFNWFDLIVHPR